MRDAIVVACSFRLTPDDLLARLRKLLGSDSGNARGFIVSSSAHEERDMGGGWTLLPTDNHDFDFSAYLTGVETVIARCPEARAVIFLNDSLFTNHAAAANFRALQRQLGLVQELELPAMAGKTDLYTTVCLSNPWSRLDRYVTTFCFVLNRQALPLMLQLRSMAEQDGVTHDHDVDSPEWASRLPGAFRLFLKAMLVYRHSPYLWYRLGSGHHSASQLRSKARCIYFEHRLSGAISEAGCLLPTNAGPRWDTYLTLHERLSRFKRWICL